MDTSGRNGLGVLVLALLLVAGLFALGAVGIEPAVSIALMAAVPLLAAVFLSVSRTVLIAVVAVLAAVALAWLAGAGDLTAFWLPVAGVVVGGLAAVLSARMRPSIQASAGPVATPATAVSKAGGEVDAMTGLLSRAGAVRALADHEEDERLLAFLDCDLFRQVNEDYGTEVGDEFLQAIAGRLRHSLPARDTVARWEADEFLVVLTADASAAMPALQRLADSISGHPVRTAAGPIEASVSVGAASWRPGQSLEDVIARASRALRSAKAVSRGQVVLDGGEEPVGRD